jgi:hypothetical protein
MIIPDVLFPTDNDLDIPTLDIARQAEFVVLPFCRWGDRPRTSIQPGTYHFYTDDYKFNRLWTKPNNLLATGCSQIVESNFSTNDQMPLSVGIWAIYRKRWLARYWQHYGVSVIVDLYVSPKFQAINLYGVPRGWQAYCTRVTMAQYDHAEQDYETAREHADGRPVLFVVYGGARAVEELCQARGWVWIAEDMYVKRRWRNG